MSWLRRRALPAGEDRRRPPDHLAGRRLVGIPMLLLILAIGVADVLFALDSIPAVFGITTSAYLIVACNAFALMGLRQVYVLLTRVLDRIVYLNSGLAVICAFIGIKLLLQALHGSGAVGGSRPGLAVGHRRRRGPGDHRGRQRLAPGERHGRPPRTRQPMITSDDTAGRARSPPVNGPCWSAASPSSTPTGTACGNATTMSS